MGLDPHHQQMQSKKTLDPFFVMGVEGKVLEPSIQRLRRGSRRLIVSNEHQDVILSKPFGRG